MKPFLVVCVALLGLVAPGLAGDLDELIGNSPWLRASNDPSETSTWTFSGAKLIDERVNWTEEYGYVTSTYTLDYAVDEAAKTLTYKMVAARAVCEKGTLPAQPDVAPGEYTVPYRLDTLGNTFDGIDLSKTGMSQEQIDMLKASMSQEIAGKRRLVVNNVVTFMPQ